MRVLAFGRDGAMEEARQAEPRFSLERVEYARTAGWAEWYTPAPGGLEQGFTVRTRPSGDGALRVELSCSGPLSARAVGDRIEFLDASAAVILLYGKLAARDALGRALPGWMAREGSRVVLRVDDAGAEYPVEIDPLVWTQEGELVASDPSTNAFLGMSVAVSGDTAIAGAGGTANAYVFVRSGNTWTQQAKLVASVPADVFGHAVALNGDTAIVGALNQGTTHTGAADVFVRSGSAWSQQATLLASDESTSDSFGFSVSLSGDTVVVGANQQASFTGAAYVFTRSGTAWSQQAKLVAHDAAMSDNFGYSVSASGDTAVVGAKGKAVNTGATYVFVRSGGTWSEQAKLVASDASAMASFGASVSVSGESLIVGAVSDSSSRGAAYVFVRSNGAWTQQAKLVLADAAVGDVFGDAVALDVDTAVAGAYGRAVARGAAYGFRRSAGVWTQLPEMVAADGAGSDRFGTAVALNGDTAVVGAYQKKVAIFAAAGTAYAFTLRGSKGDACTHASDCQSGFCQDGVCCDTACTGRCEACDVPQSAGICVPASGAPRGSRPACGGPPCGTTCDGQDRTECHYPREGTPCTVGACGGACDGKGVCQASATCAATCSADGVFSTPSNGDAPIACTPFRCGGDGTCLKECATSDDCAPGYACRAGTKACERGATAASSGGCSIALATTAARGGAASLLIAPGLLRLLRRRRGSGAKRCAPRPTDAR
jgi:hypothetical protein